MITLIMPLPPSMNKIKAAQNQASFGNKKSIKGNYSTYLIQSTRNRAKKFALDYIKNQSEWKPLTHVTSLTCVIFWNDKRKRDVHNLGLKEYLDGLVEGGLFTDDNHTVIPNLNLQFGGYDKENPRLEVHIMTEELYSLHVTTVYNSKSHTFVAGFYKDYKVASTVRETLLKNSKTIKTCLVQPFVPSDLLSLPDILGANLDGKIQLQ